MAHSAKVSARTSTPVTLISDATGSLGEHVLDAIFTQFPPGSFTLNTISFVNSEETLTQCLETLQRTTGLVVHATIYPEFKQRIEATCKSRGLSVYDLTGPIMGFIQTASGLEPNPDYERLHELSPEYFRRIEAIEFTIAHDDAQGLGTIHQADVILTGVSRTTKTPTSMALAMHGYRAANAPIVPEVEPPKALLSADPQRVICLVLQPSSLAAVRALRARTELGFTSGYTELEQIQHELTRSRKLSAERKWRLLDVTGCAIEETAARIMGLVPRPGPRRPRGASIRFPACPEAPRGVK